MFHNFATKKKNNHFPEIVKEFSDNLQIALFPHKHKQSNEKLD